MEFYEKLDFLMNITNTTNSALGQKVKIDPSYISRLRRGKRRALKEENIISSMAEYFANHCTDPYQLKSISDTLNNSEPIDNANELQKAIVNWLIEDNTDEIKAIETFMDNFADTKDNNKLIKMDMKSKEKNYSKILPNENISIYYGVEGKRQAAEIFLQEVINSEIGQKLLLYSDEPTDWMSDRPDFTVRWTKLMIGILSKGIKIKIIHTISRDLDEMLKAINQWMPLYMTGLIEPYYYPKKRDGIFKQTMFICPDVSAVISNSVGNSIDYSPNLLIGDKDAIKAYSEVFNQYLSQCKQLIKIFSSKNKDSYLETLLCFEKEKSNTIIKTESLSILTMPENISLKILSRIGRSNTDIIEYQKNRLHTFRQHLKDNFFYEIVPKLDLGAIKNGKIKVSFSDLMNGETVYYTQEEYIQHLENLIYLLETYENFHIKLTESSDSNYIIYVKEDVGVINAKTMVPSVAIAINEINLIATFWDFLRNIIGEKVFYNPNNMEEIKNLKEYINKIKEN